MDFLAGVSNFSPAASSLASPLASSPSTPLRKAPERDSKQASPATRAMLAQQRDHQRAAHLTTAERNNMKAEQAAEKEDRASERVRSRWQTALVAMRAETTRLREDLSDKEDAQAVGVLEEMLDEAADSAVAYAGALEELRRQRDAALARAEAAETKAAEQKQRADRADVVIKGLHGLRPALMKMVAALPGTALAEKSGSGGGAGRSKGRRRRAD